VLQVSASLGSEEYRRFYFRDIQAITIRGTKRRMFLNIVFGSLWALAVILGVWLRGPGLVFVPILSLLFSLPMLINSLLGPCCDVQLRTAVQIEELPSLSRIRRTHRVLNRIRPLIISAQGQLTPDDLSARLRAIVPPPIMKRATVTSPLGLSSFPQDPPKDPAASPTEAGVP
jgi:hypothetical protein